LVKVCKYKPNLKNDPKTLRYDNNYYRLETGMEKKKQSEFDF